MKDNNNLNNSYASEINHSSYNNSNNDLNPNKTK